MFTNMNNTTMIRYMYRWPQSKPFIATEITTYIYVVTLIVGIIGNSLVLFSLLSRRRRKRMSANDVFILNLTIADLMLLLIFIPYALYIRLAPFNPTVFICKSTAPLITIALGGMVYTLTAMSVHRCFVITRPFSRECSLRCAATVVIVIWLVSIGLSIPKIIVAAPKIVRVPCSSRMPCTFKKMICVSKWTKSSLKSYTASLFVLRFAIPFCVIMVSYVKIAIALLKTQAPRFSTDSSGNIRNVTNKRENIEVIKTLFVISFLFFILMLPFRVTRLMRVLGWTDPLLRNIYQLTATLTIAHSCVNPIIYGTFIRKFKKDYKRFFVNLFCCRLCRDRPNGDDEATSHVDRLELEEGCNTSDHWRKPVSTSQTDVCVYPTCQTKSSEDFCLLSNSARKNQ